MSRDRNNINELLQSLENEFSNYIGEYAMNYINNRYENSRTTNMETNTETRTPVEESVPNNINSNTDISGNMNDRWSLNQYHISDLIQQYNFTMREYNDSVTQLMNNYRSLIDSYNDNMSQYQRNISNIARTIHISQQNLNTQNLWRHNVDAEINNEFTHIRNSGDSRNSRTLRRTNNQNNLMLSSSIPFNRTFTYYMPLNGLRNNLSRTSSLRNVISTEQIDLSTQMVTYDNSYTELRCPISWEDFTIGENVCQIKHCGHIFKNSSLMNWLRTDPHCPLCRYDLRTYREETTNNNDEIHQDTSNTNNEEIQQDTSNNNNNEDILNDNFLDSILNNVMQRLDNDFLNSIDPSNNVLYTTLELNLERI
jgi:hypothetical protein